MSLPLHLLIVEDSAADAEFMLREVERAGFDVRWRRVQTEAAFLAALEDPPEVIFSDFSMPQFSGTRALELLSGRGQDIPFILISGTLGEEAAVESMKLGAADYLIKDRLARLGHAVQRALEDRRLRGQRRFEEDQARLQTTALEAAANAIVITNASGEVEWINPAFTRMTGYPLAEVAGQSLRLLKSGQHDTEFYRALWETVLAGDVWEGEIVNRRKDGTLYPELMTITPVRGAEGRIGHFIAIKQDYSERKRAAEELRLTNEKLRQLLAHSPAVIYTLKLEGGNIAPAVVSDNIERLLGVTVAECSSFDWWLTSLHPEDRERAAGGFRAALARGDYSMEEYRIRAKDGSYRWIEDNYRVIRDASGQPVEAVGVWMDITERKQSEQRLAEQAALLDQANDAILVYDLEHRIRYWNKCAERLYGWSTAETDGKSVKALLQRDPAAFNAAIEATIRDGEWAGEIAQFSRDGRELSVEARWTLVRDSSGHAGSILAINTDITEKKKLEAQFLRAQRMESIGTLAGGIAHDLNNVLAPILISIQLIEEEVRSEDGRSMLATIQTCAQRGADLVKQVLSFARGAEGERIEVNVGHLLRDVSHVIRETFPKNIQSAFHAGPDLWRVGGDPTQLHQVFMNLCVNARDAMPEGGRLLIQAENAVLDDLYAGMSPESRPGPYAVVEVEDTGMGIPARIRERIFEPFFTTKDTGKGTGLGLSTTLGIVRSHGGFIQVSSEPGKGSTFKVYLPARATESVVEQPIPEKGRLSRGNGELLLVVDDEAVIRDVTRKTLERFGYRVLVAGNGAEAVALYASHRDDIALVLTDMAMPIMDGPSAIVALKALNPRVRIVATSGLHIEGAQAKPEGAGIRDFISKPFTAEALLNVLAKAMAEPSPPEGH